MTTAHKPHRTTGIGSLPHHNVDAALDFSFRMAVPFLPQIPIRNPWEFLIAQALEGLPGLQVERDGSAHLKLDVWTSRAAQFSRKLGAAFEESDRKMDAFEAFEPSAATASSWQPFVWELEERGIARLGRQAKVQIAGPMTAQWALRLNGASGQNPMDTQLPADLQSQIYRLVLARALAMTRRLKSLGVKPLVFLDEPGLYGFSRENPKHLLGIQELKILIKTLSKEGAQVGMHCCSNTNWSVVLGLGLHVLSIDTSLSLESLLSDAHTEALNQYLGSGGRLSLGAIPTARSSVLRSLSAQEILSDLLETFANASSRLVSSPEVMRNLLSHSLLTPACGLALHTIEDAELVVEILTELDQRVEEFLRG